jgi:adenylate kinase
MRAGSPPRDWTVLLIGGTSGAGKTTAAQELARRFGVGLAQADAFRLALQRATSPAHAPALHGMPEPGTGVLDPAEACRRWIEVARTVSHALEIVIAFHLATRAPLILEGDTVLPALARCRYLPGLPPGWGVRAIFLVEPDCSRILEACRRRGRDGQILSEAEQLRDARRHWLYGQWLCAEAERCGTPVLVPGGERLADAIAGALRPALAG